MKILMLNYEYPPLGGGTGVACFYLLSEFAWQKNLYLDLLTSSPGGYCEDNLNSHLRIIRFNTGKKNHNLHHQNLLTIFNYFIQSTLWVLRHKGDYDLIHAFSGLPGAITAWLSGKPYIVSFRGGEEPGYEPRYDTFLRLIKPFLKLVYSRAKFLDANSRYLKNLVLQSFPDLSIQVIYNGVDRKKFYPARKPINQPIILCTSRLGKRKGVEFLIQALALVPQAKLLLAGSGKHKPKILQLVKNLHLAKRVKFLGTVPHTQLPSLYRQARLFVLPSLSESCSNALLEAMASGLPVVATAVGGNPELVNDSNGILVPSADSQALAVALNKILSSKQRRKQIKLNSWQETAKKYYQIYSQQFS